MMALLYKAQSSLKTSKSTLFLSICMLNRLISKNFSFSDETYSLIVGTILRISLAALSSESTRPQKDHNSPRQQLHLLI